MTTILTLQRKITAALASLALIAGLGLTTFVSEAQATPNTGWQEEAGEWYYFDASGTRLISSWLAWNNNWYYFDDQGHMLAFTWLEWNDTWYYFSSDGRMLTSSWLQSGDNWYYFSSDGKMLASSWLPLNGKWYYFDATGVMLHSKYPFNDNGKEYLLGPDGSMITGWQQVSGYSKPLSSMVATVWFYAESDGTPASGWKYMDGAWYFFTHGLMESNHYAWSIGADGFIYYGLRYTSMGPPRYTPAGPFGYHGPHYHFRSDGTMATGWVLVRGKWLYATTSGELIETDWLWDNGTWYYFEDCLMIENTTKEIDGENHAFGADGAWLGVVE
ncbi:MAG: hypothetical protein GX483_07565 [Actinomycetaceae bacterium]|nr:hypothetical protein [Actinomycetaceae bacterium]